MARKSAAASTPRPKARKSSGARARSRSGPPSGADRAASSAATTAARVSFAGLPNMPDLKMMTPEQAIELYKANAKLALDIISATIDSTAKLRKKQFEGEEEARAFQQKAARSAASAGDAQALVAAGQGVAQEALERSMRYWGEMFDLIVEMQRRLYAMIEEQAEAMPGVKQAKAAMAL